MLNRSASTSTQKSSVPALTRGLKIIELLAAADRPQTLSSIAKHYGIAMSSAHAICATLLKEGYIEKFEDRSFQLTRKLRGLVDLATKGDSI
jgi:DNA-binding IclR family transcriptional regulator